MTARAADGTPLLDLPAADLVISEGGQPRRIIRVEPSRTALKIAVAVEERLAPDDDVRRSVANFIDHVRTAGQVALYVVGRRSEQRVDYTSEIVPFARAINGFPARGVDPGNVVEAVKDIARDQRSREGRRVIVVVGIAGQPGEQRDGGRGARTAPGGIVRPLRGDTGELEYVKRARRRHVRRPAAGSGRPGQRSRRRQAVR